MGIGVQPKLLDDASSTLTDGSDSTAQWGADFYMLLRSMLLKKEKRMKNIHTIK